jgi:sugar O-acyltransferase (sialic acid O-acetyltransferase NeuD family)
MKNPIVIVGAGGLGKSVACLLGNLGEFEIVGFYDDGQIQGSHILDEFEVLGNIRMLQEIQTEISAVIAFGNPGTRKKIWEQLSTNPLIKFPNLIHPTAFLMNTKRIQLGSGVVIFPQAVLTTDVVIGNNVVIHIGASVHHDVSIGSHSVIMPGARLVVSEQLEEGSFVESNYFKPHSF